MVTFCIIEELEERGSIYNIGKYRGNLLWLADDTTLIANSKEYMEKNIKVLKEAAIKYGLEVNEKKSKITQIRGKDNLKEIANFEVVKEVKYLGIIIGGTGRSIFNYEKKTRL